LVIDEKDNQRFTLVYHVPKKDFFGRPTAELEQRTEIYECAESDILLKTFQGIRNKIMCEMVRTKKIN
jgi:hypothetical protein